MTKVIVPSKLPLRYVYKLLSKRNLWQDILQFDVQPIGESEWRLDAIVEWNGRPVTIKPIDAQIICGASSQRWGVMCEGNEAAGFWNRRHSRSHTAYRELINSCCHGESLRQTVLELNADCASYIESCVQKQYNDNREIHTGVFNTSGSLSRIEYSPYLLKK